MLRAQLRILSEQVSYISQLLRRSKMRYRELKSEADHESKGSNDSRGFAGD